MLQALPQLAEPVRIGTLMLRNRLYRAPVLEGAGSHRDPARVYRTHFEANARAGVGLIIQGNTVVTPHGRTSPGMCSLEHPDDLLAMRSLTDAVHRHGAAIVLQLGHGGTFSLEAWHRDWRPGRAHDPWSPSPLPWWLRGIHPGVRPMSDADIRALIERFGASARAAREAGYDGVQLAASNAKLLHQFLTPTWNRRRDAWGGDPGRRFALMAAIRESIARAAGPDFPVWLKYTAREHTPFGTGMSLEEGIDIGRRAVRAGFDALTPVSAHALPNTSISRGAFPEASFTQPNLRRRFAEATGTERTFGLMKLGMRTAAAQYPHRSLWNRWIASAVRHQVDIPVFAVGGFETRAQMDEVLAAGDADLVGVGRPFYTEPGLAARLLAGDGAPVACRRCNQCIVPQMLGMPGVCYNAEVNRAAR